MTTKTCLVLGMLLFVAVRGEAQTAANCDFDGNGVVDFGDFLMFAGAFGSADARFDLTGSGAVAFEDFLVFVSFWGTRIGPVRELVVSLPGGVEMVFVKIEPGTFMMGAPDEDEMAYPWEKPQHQVTISKGFYLGKYEVTQGQWEAVMGTTPWRGRGWVVENPIHPAGSVNWDDAQAFAHRLNEAAGEALYRLPTEAEWEYACRAGTRTRWSFGDNESQLKDYAWYRDNSDMYGQPVGTKLPNVWGLYDMQGNVFEWVQDWYGPYTSSAKVDPVASEVGSDDRRVARSGYFGYIARRVRCADRAGGPPSVYPPTAHVGFRLLRIE